MASGDNVLKWKKISGNGLDLSYALFLSRVAATRLLQQLEHEVTYLPPEVARVKVFGHWHPIPRQQVAFGDPGLTYRFSGNTVLAQKWPRVVAELRDNLHNITGQYYNFVLINRYRDGNDHMGEHRDDESELDPSAPIASVSLGQSRLFMLRHKDARKKGVKANNIPPVKIMLEHGSLLMMNPPTNQCWYHSLPRRKSCPGVRVNLTFRRIIKYS